jgi:cytochrome c peroxidase
MTSCSIKLDLRDLAAGILTVGSLFSLVACTPSGNGQDLDNLQLSEVQGGLSSARLQRQLLSAPFGYRPLSREPIPQPTNGHIVDQQAAIRLGKAFFWDIQAGSDGQVACATCHASAGADNRRFNTLHPGRDGIFNSGGVTAPNQTYSPVVIQNDDVVGTQGVSRRLFVSINPDPAIANDTCTEVVDPIFGTARRVVSRQAPMIFGAAFFRTLFWAGEASPRFNGLDIWGFGPNNTVGSIADMGNSALASQASGPPGNGTEMRCTGRALNGANSLATKMLARPPLQFQRVSPTDSVLGAMANPAGPGLLCGNEPCSYRSMIAQAFGPAMAADAEQIFSLIWGESVQAYELTLIPDRTPFDRFLSGHFDALTPKQIFGLVRFVGKGKCAVCHAGPMFSDATVAFYQEHGPLNRDGGDQGFHNIGLANSRIDGGRGGLGPGNAPLSDSESLFDDWAFKTPTLRNVKLTAPYFHTGSNPTLENVMDFYIRGGDFANSQLSADITPLDLTAFDKAAIIDFMANGLTDCRVEKQRAPFDHPELQIVNGPLLPAVGASGTGSCRRGEHDDDDDDSDSDDD